MGLRPFSFLDRAGILQALRAANPAVKPYPSPNHAVCNSFRCGGVA